MVAFDICEIYSRYCGLFYFNIIVIMFYLIHDNENEIIFTKRTNELPFIRNAEKGNQSIK